jgi:hypothetical protein
MYIGPHVELLLFLSDLNETLIFLTDLMKNRPVVAELFHTDGRTDGQTDMTKLIFAFRKRAEASKYYTISELLCSSLHLIKPIFILNC